MIIKELINRGINKECMKEYDKNKIFNYLRHTPNAMKTDKEFKLYCEMANEETIEILREKGIKLFRRIFEGGGEKIIEI
ncbi:MAG: hypothetical protein ACLVME_06535 [Ezakiella coagulans]|uniref:hypothetical protein n=1 Tax=Ezakiella coagulans TaxID=46507 RepID=UPI002014B0A1|nr:hypothetical protein [Ezakiella coagulans]UQK60688.1 hypothetical protein M1R54_09295 [Ezakiella coagulans]